MWSRTSPGRDGSGGRVRRLWLRAGPQQRPQLLAAAARGGSIDAAFRLHEGRVLAGTLRWAARAGAGTTKGRDTPLHAGRPVHLPLARLLAGRRANGRTAVFRYLLITATAAQDNSLRTDAGTGHAADGRATGRTAATAAGIAAVRQRTAGNPDSRPQAREPLTRRIVHPSAGNRRAPPHRQPIRRIHHPYPRDLTNVCRLP